MNPTVSPTRPARSAAGDTLPVSHPAWKGKLDWKLLLGWLRDDSWVTPDEAERVTRVLAGAGETVQEIGVIEKAPTDEADCIVDNADSLWRS